MLEDRLLKLRTPIIKEGLQHPDLVIGSHTGYSDKNDNTQRVFRCLDNKCDVGSYARGTRSKCTSSTQAQTLRYKTLQSINFIVIAA